MKKSEYLRTVLLIDDDEGILDVTTRMMEKLGYRVLTAESGNKALEIAATYTGPIDAVLMDICLPGIRGKELFHRMMGIRPQMNVVICSGFADEALVNQIIGLGASGYIQKPVTLATLSSKLEEITERRKHKRHAPQKDAFAVIKSLFSSPCKINDISMGGLSFFSEQSIEESNKHHKIQLAIRHTDFNLDRIPCDLISDGNKRQIPQHENIKRFSMEFSTLSNEQTSILASCLQNHTL